MELEKEVLELLEYPERIPAELPDLLDQIPATVSGHGSKRDEPARNREEHDVPDGRDDKGGEAYFTFFSGRGTTA